MRIVAASARRSEIMETSDAVANQRISVAQRPLTTELERQPFIALSVTALADEGVDLSELSAKDLLRRPPDIAHVHWPGHVLAPGVTNRAKSLALLLALGIARRRGTRLVNTAHNAGPHDAETSPFDRWFLDRFDAMVDDLIVMSRAGRSELLQARPGLRGARHHHIRHGHFRPLLQARPRRTEAKARLGFSVGRQLVVFAGLIRPYKGVPDLLRAASGVDVDVLIAGRCDDAELKGEIESLAAANPAVHTRYEFLTNEQLSVNLRAADLVVLPYRHILNSGAVILALSADRRVLVPDTPTFEELAHEVGRRWVSTFPCGHLDADRLAEVLDAEEPSGHPDLSRYEWAEVAAQLRAVYAGDATPLEAPTAQRAT